MRKVYRCLFGSIALVTLWGLGACSSGDDTSNPGQPMDAAMDRTLGSQGDATEEEEMDSNSADVPIDQLAIADREAEGETANGPDAHGDESASDRGDVVEGSVAGGDASVEAILMDAGAAEADSTILATPEIDDIWPTTGAPGLAVLIEGQHLEEVSTLVVGGVPVTATLIDLSIADHEKVFATIPDGLDAGSIVVQLKTGSGLTSPSLDYLIASVDVSAPSGPAPYQPIPVLYPPISDDWVNECDSNDSYAVFGVVGDAGAYTFGGYRNEIEQLAGSDNTSDGLIRLMFTDESSITRDYVGLYSNTGDYPDAETRAFRMVLFPVSNPTRQLVLFVCGDDTTSCDDGGDETPNPGPRCNNE